MVARWTQIGEAQAAEEAENDDIDDLDSDDISPFVYQLVYLVSQSGRK